MKSAQGPLTFMPRADLIELPIGGPTRVSDLLKIENVKTRSFINEHNKERSNVKKINFNKFESYKQ